MTLESLVLAAQSPDRKGLGNHKVPKLDFKQMQRVVGPIQHICSKLFLLILSLQSTKLNACSQPQIDQSDAEQRKC